MPNTAGRSLPPADVTQDLLARKEQQLREAQRIARLGSWELDLATRAFTWSDELFQLFGYLPNAITPSLRRMAKHAHPDDRRETRALVAEALRSLAAFDHTFRIVRIDGAVRHIRARGRSLLSADGRPCRILGVCQDVTESLETANDLRRQAIELKQALDMVRQAERYKDEFFSVINHELRNPLNAMAGYVNLMENGVGGQVREEHQTFMTGMRSAVDRMARLVDDLLDMAKMQAGEFRVFPRRTELTPLLAEACAAVMPSAARKHIALKLEHATQVAIDLDEARISQVVVNLLSNAVKFTPEGGTITLRTSQRGATLRMEVIDTGIGIDEKDKHRLFRRFSQLDSSNTRQAEGTGLGLYICKAILEAHGGDIGVDSTAGAGSTFWFSLPLLASIGAEGARGATLGVDREPTTGGPLPTESQG